MNGTANIFTANGYNKRGQPTGFTLGNGLTATLGYDDYGFPTSISIPGIQKLEYEFDTLTGNLNLRKDVAKGLQENFTYDNLLKNRLETWQVNTETTYGVNYANNGNINTKTGLGAFSYNAPQPNAVSEIENTGNLVSEVEQIVKYTPFNKVDTIREGNYRLEITYGHNEARKITRLYNNNVLEKTKYYAGGNYEVEVDASGNERKLHYINGGDGLAAIFEKTNTAENLYYIHKDHLGSFTAITDANGVKVDSMSFDPWGRRRNPANWTFNNMPSGYLFDRGYTGHEHLDEFSLINMNGRVYDPLLGRFMSPDNYIQAPDYTQNFNRYSYALNNPLVYIDPSGDFIAEAITLLAFTYFGGVQSNFLKSSASGSNPFNPANWDWSSPGTYVGLGLGALNGYSNVLKHCEYLVDVNTGEKILHSHLGEGKLNFLHYGEWVDNHSAFRLINTVVKDVPFGGVDNIRNITRGAFLAESLHNSLMNQPQQFIKEYQSNGWERFQISFGFFGNVGYNLIDQAWITTQKMILQKSSNQIAHLNRAGIEGSEFLDAGINTMTNVFPVSKIGKSLQIARTPLNVAKFNTVYKESGIYAAKSGGYFIRQSNYVIRNNTNIQNTWTGIGLGGYFINGF